jgi:hypothetical protein
MRRRSRAARIFPNVDAAFKAVPEFIRFTQLKTFVASARSCTFARPATRKSRKRPRSTLR